MLPRYAWSQDAAQPPVAPALLTPGKESSLQNVGGEPWSFSWSARAGVSRYNIEVWARKAKTPTVNAEVTTNSYVHQLPQDFDVAEKLLKKWTWRVRAFNGQWGPWSEKGRFHVMTLQATTNLRCYGNVQDLIAWDYNGSLHWDDASLQQLCDGAPDPFQPGACFDRTMHGGVSWGNGSRWQMANALDLCQRSADAEQTIGCFQNTVAARVNWAEAIRLCSNAP